MSAALRAEGLLNESVGAGYLDRNWPEALKESGAWPLKGLRQCFSNGSLTRLLDPEEVLRRQIATFVEKGEMALASGPKPEGGYDRVWWKERIGPEEVAFDDKTFLLTRGRAAALVEQKSAAVQPPASEPEPREFSLEPLAGEAPSAGARSVRLQLIGQIPPEQWNRLGTRLIPKLRGAGQDVVLSLEPGVTIRAADLAQVEADLRQVLADLGLDGLVQIRKQ